MAGLCALLTDPTRRTTYKYTRTYLGSGLYLCGVSWAKLAKTWTSAPPGLLGVDLRVAS